jgi:two-component sensor histidine kinase
MFATDIALPPFAVCVSSPVEDRSAKAFEDLSLASPSDRTEPVVERNSREGSAADTSGRALRQRIRQQELLAELGVFALKGASFIEMLNHAAKITAEGLEAEYCKVLEYLPAEKRLIVRAGVGWDEGVVGHATVGSDLASPSGYALRTGKPVISNHLKNEERFRTPELLIEHGIHRAMNVILQGDGSPFGVLEVDSRSEGEFSEYDIAFLQGAANIIGMALEQQQYRRKLQAALERHQILLKEVNHRVKNSLQVVSGMLQLQANSVGEPSLSQRLKEASARISTVGRAYERLAYDADYEKIDLVSYVREVINDLESAVAPYRVELEAPEEIQFAADRAILVALVINELVLNAGKYAYPQSQSGSIWVRLVRTRSNLVLISVRDEGAGLPAGFDPMMSKRLGLRLSNALAKQLGAELTRPTSPVGTNFTLLVPLNPSETHDPTV